MKLSEGAALLTGVTPGIGPHLQEQEESGLSCHLLTGPFQDPAPA